MKKLFFASVVVLGTIGMSSCGDNAGTNNEENEMVIDRDTTVSELEVQERAVQMDTTTETETIDVNEQNQ